MEACMKSNKFVDEKEYEVKGVRQSERENAPFMSRTSMKKLFEKHIIYFKGELGDDVPPVGQCEELVKIGGGQVIKSEMEFEKEKQKFLLDKKIIIITKSIGFPDTQDGVKIIQGKTLIDAITNFKEI